MSMSQRLFSFLLGSVLFALIAGIALAQGATISFLGTTEEVVLRLGVPFFGVFLLMSNWFKALEAKILEDASKPDGLKPGDNVGLFTLTAFWVYLLGVAAAAYQLFGLPFISENTKTIIMDGLVMGVTVVLDALGRRPAGSTITTEIRVQALSAQPPKRE